MLMTNQSPRESRTAGSVGRGSGTDDGPGIDGRFGEDDEGSAAQHEEDRQGALSDGQEAVIDRIDGRLISSLRRLGSECRNEESEEDAHSRPKELTADASAWLAASTASSAVSRPGRDPARP